MAATIWTDPIITASITNAPPYSLPGIVEHKDALRPAPEVLVISDVLFTSSGSPPPSTGIVYPVYR